MIKTVLDLFVELLIPVIGVGIYTFICPNIIQEKFVAILLSSIVTVGIMFFINRLLLILNKFKAIRFLINPLGKFEGMWVSKVNISTRPISIFWLEYNSINDTYIYKGSAYDIDGNECGDWYSTEITLLPSGGFRFHANGHIIYKSNNNTDDKLIPTESSGYLIFEKSPYKKFLDNYFQATGYLIDWCEDNQSAKLLARKVTKQYLKDKTGKDNIETKEDLTEFVKALLH